MQHEPQFAASPPFSGMLLTLYARSAAVQLTNGRCELPLQVAAGAPGIRCLHMIWLQLQHSCEVSNGFIQLAHLFKDSAPAAGVKVRKAGMLLRQSLAHAGLTLPLNWRLPEIRDKPSIQRDSGLQSFTLPCS